MHILFATPAYPPMPGGGERYAASLAANLRARGHKVTVITSSATQESHLWDGSSAPAVMNGDPLCPEALRLPVRPFFGGRTGLMAYRKLMVLLSSLPGDQSRPLSTLARRVPYIDGLDAALAAAPDVDIIHAFNVSWESAMVAAYSLAQARQRPLVLTPFAHFGAGVRDRVARNSTMDHQLQLLRAAAHVLVLTDVERAGLTELGVPAERIVVLGGSPDPLPADWASALPAVQDLALPEPYVLFVGRASRDKGALDAAEAVVRLRQQGRQIALVLAGSSSPEFDRWLAQLPAGDRAGIVPLGLVSEEMKHALLSRSSMLLLPSRSDSFGIVLLEAWQHAKPVIGARAGGIPGVIDNERNGLLVAYGDVAGLSRAVARLLDDPALSTALGADGQRKIATEYTWEQTAARAEMAYRQLMEVG